MWTEFLHIFLRERFGAIAPKPVEFSAAEMEETVVRGVRSKD